MIRWWGHLKVKVLAFGVAMSVLPLSLFGWYGLGTVRLSQVQIVQAQNRAAAATVAEELSRTVTQTGLQLGLVARLEGSTLTRIPALEQERILYALLRDLPYLEEAAVAGPDGRELVRVSRREVLAGQDLPEHGGTPLWQEVLRGRTALGPVLLDVDGRPMITLAVPLPDGQGALLARATLRGLVAGIPAVRGSGPARLHVVAEDGRLIGSSDFSLVLAGTRMELLPEGDEPYISITRTEALGVAAAVPGLPWRVVGETALADGMAPVRKLVTELAVAAGLLMAVVIALSVGFSLELIEPLERLEGGAVRVGAGDLSHRIPGGGRDELGRLITAFNRMTGRLQQQDAGLRAERDRLDTVVSSIGAGLALIGAGGTVLWANRTLREWFPGSLEGRPCREALGREDCTGCDGGTCPGMEHAVWIGGRSRILRHHTYALGDAEGPGEPARLEVLEDVTDRRAMEAMVRQSEKLAAVGQLAAGVAHEINNPLAVISAYAEDLTDRLQEEGAATLQQSGELHAYLGQLQRQALRCKAITTNLLDFARRGPAEPEPVDVAAVARQTADLVAARARRAGIAVVVQMADGLPLVRASRDQLQQVYLNLITNALDALEEKGGGTITLPAGAAGDGRLDLAVADDGPGMDGATLDRAMEPFFTTKPPGKGTGLGLSTCYGIISGLGGDMHLESAPGRGTTVHFTLPLWGGMADADLGAADRR